MEEYKIYYNSDGWVCERYPHDLSIDNKKRFLKADEKTFNRTLEADVHFAWRVVDGELSHERYEPTPETETIQVLRDKREDVCFPIINRGQLWHESLTAEQRAELKKWYENWLAVTTTKTEPPKPRWLLSREETDGADTD